MNVPCGCSGHIGVLCCFLKYNAFGITIWIRFSLEANNCVRSLRQGIILIPSIPPTHTLERLLCYCCGNTRVQGLELGFMFEGSE